MPFQDEGTLNPNLPAARAIVNVAVPTTQPTINGFTVTPDPQTGKPAPLLQEQPRSLAEAAEIASDTVTVIPAATAPAIANLPTTARAGQMFSFAANPSAIYVYGSDNVWRALLLVPVV